MRHLLILLFLIIGCMLSSCKKDNRCGVVLFGGASIFNEQAIKSNEAGEVYVNDPTLENCNAFRAEVRKYIDDLNSYRDCVAEDQLLLFDTDITNYETQLSQINCF